MNHTIHAHQFDNLDQQRAAVSLGMWLFLATEVMFFGGLFLCYTIYRWRYPVAWAEGSRHLVLVLGAINTAILLVSSYTVALAVHAAQSGQRRALTAFLLLTILLGLCFLGIKGYEYWDEYHKHLFPGTHFQLHDPVDPDVDPDRVEMFYSLYFAMTCLHAFHMLIGLAVFGVLLVMALTGRLSHEHFMPVDMAGLYWHFVDIVWIFLFPLLYLVK